MRLRVLVVSALLWATGQEVGAQPPAKDKWRTYETGNFQFYSNAPRGRTRELVDSFGRLHSLITTGGRRGLEATPVVVLVFKSQRSMDPYLREPPHTRDIVTSWESFHTGDRLWLLLNADIGDDVRPLAYRAYVSNYIHASMPELPYWARNGLASFYAGFRDKRGTEVAVGLPHPRHIGVLRQSTLMPWRQFFQTGRDGGVLDQGRTLGLFNAQAWIAAHYLMTGGSKPELGGKFFSALRSGGSEESILRDLYGFDLEAFNNEVLNYLHAPALPFFPWDVGQLEVGEVAERDVPRPELLYLLASYLVEGHRPPPMTFTEQHLEPLYGDGGYGAQARVLEARLRMEVDDTAGARELFEQALAMPAAGAAEWLEYASFLSEVDAPPEDVRQAASTALDLGAEGPSARHLLGQTLTTVPEAEEEMELYASALSQLGGSMPHVAHNLALGYMRSGDFESARGVIEHNLRPYVPADADDLLQVVVHNEVVAAANAAMAKDDVEAAIAAYDKGILEIADPDAKESFTRTRDQLLARTRSDRQWQAVGDAVDLANSGDRGEAAAMLRSLLEEGVDDDRLRSEIVSLLERIEG